MSENLDAEERERYELAAAYMRHGVVSRSEAERLWGLPPGFRDKVAEERDRREWTEGVRRRLGLVAEVHRCQVHQGNPEWIWSCLRDGCHAAGYFCPSQPDAFALALAHARSFVPAPLAPEPVTELEWAVYVAYAEDAARQREADEAALRDRISAVTEQVSAAFAGLLPDGMRFEWK